MNGDDEQHGIISNNGKVLFDGTLPEITQIPVKKGYTFLGYFDATTNGTQYYDGNGAAITGKTWDKDTDATLYAQWDANDYTVTLAKNEGEGGTDSVSATFDSAMPTITVPTRTGYIFNGYFYDLGGTNEVKYYNANGTSAHVWDIDQAAELTASWTPIKYNVIYDSNATNSSTVSSLSGNITNLTDVEYDQLITINGALTMTNYNFLGWALSADATEPTYTAGQEDVSNIANVAGDVILFAVWQGKEKTVVINVIYASYQRYARLDLANDIIAASGITLSRSKTENGPAYDVGYNPHVASLGSSTLQSNYEITYTARFDDYVTITLGEEFNISAGHMGKYKLSAIDNTLSARVKTTTILEMQYEVVICNVAYRLGTTNIGAENVVRTESATLYAQLIHDGATIGNDHYIITDFSGKPAEFPQHVYESIEVVAVATLG